MLEAVIFVVFPFAMVFAALSDLFTMTIANRVSLLLLATFAIMAPVSGMDMQTFAMHFAAGGAVLLVTFTGFALGKVGGGDAKLATAIAVWCGWSPVLVEFLAWSAIFGGWLTLGLLSYRGTLISDVIGSRFAFMARLSRNDVGVPYGIALGAGGLFVSNQLPLMQWALERAAG
jgi:prepilin peptidase CpaA